MKTTLLKVTFILSLLASGGAIALAATSGNSYFKKGEKVEKTSILINSELDLQAAIPELVPCPDFFNPTESNGRVFFNLHISQDGTLTIHNLRADHAALAHYVKSRLEEVNVIATPDQRGKTIRMALQFKLI